MIEPQTLTFPTVHLNGTSAEDLTEDYRAAYSAVSSAIEALQQSAPNARDYYVQGSDAYPRARAEHERRLHALADVCRDLLALFASVEEQSDARRARRSDART